VTKHKQRLS